MTSKDFSEKTLKFCEKTSKKDKQKLGQYPTPYTILNKLFKKVGKKHFNNILETSHGTGQIFDSMKSNGITFNKCFGYEIDENLHNLCKQEYKNMDLILGNFLDQNIKERFDLIPGNPPYFMIRDKDLKKKYRNNPEFKSIIYGHLNIFILFMKKSLDLLNEDGILSFIIPVSFMNGRSYEKLRHYIVEYFNIIDIEIIDKSLFIETQIEVMIITIKKEKNDGKYVVRKNDILIFSLTWETIQNKLNNYLTIKELKGKVTTGPMIWNENKEHLLMGDENKIPKTGVPIIYSTNLVNQKIKLRKICNKNGKRQYVKKSHIKNKIINKPTILINRIIGSKNIKINCVLTENNFNFIAENHVNMISHEKIDVLKEIYEVLQKKETLDFIREIRGNVQLSQSDLENLVPIRKRETQKVDDKSNYINEMKISYEELLKMVKKKYHKKFTPNMKILIT